MQSAELFPGQERDDPNLQVVAEDAAGVTVSGMKMLATSAVYADEILIGNLTPIADKFRSEAITAALPLNAPGLSLWSRQPYAQHGRATRLTIRCRTASTRPTACWCATG